MRKITLFMMIGMLWFGACTKAKQSAPATVAADPLLEIKQTVREKFPAVQQLSTNDLATWLQDNNREKPLLIDARATDEFAVSHLQGAVHAGNDAQLVEALKDYPIDKPVVAYCSVGWRSSALAEKLMKRGYKNVVNLEGSIFQWANEGRPVYQGEQQVKQVHPFDAKWGQLLKQDLWSPISSQ